MKILQICYAYPPSFSGYGKQLKTVNDRIILDSKDIEINVITAFDGEHHKNNKNIFSFFKKSRKEYKNTLLVHYIFSLFYFLKFFNLFIKADIIHSVKAGPEAAIATIICKILKKPIIIKIVQDELEIKNKGLINKIRNWIILNWADKIVAISSKIENDLLSYNVSRNKIELINNSINTKRFIPIKLEEKIHIKNEENINIDDLVFLFLGSITKRKGVEDLLNVLEILNFEKSSTFLFIGPNYNEIKEFEYLINTLNKTKENLTIRYIPFTEIPEKFIQISDFLILPSYSEGMPNVVLEALSCEVPVILSDIEVHKSIHNSNISRLFQLGNTESLSECILTIINNPNKLLNKKNLARKYTLENHSVNLISEKYIQLYERIL